MAMSKQDQQWETESAANTLQRAEEIKMNKPLLKRAQNHLKKQQAAINKAVKTNGSKVNGSKSSSKKGSSKKK